MNKKRKPIKTEDGLPRATTLQALRSLFSVRQRRGRFFLDVSSVRRISMRRVWDA